MNRKIFLRVVFLILQFVFVCESYSQITIVSPAYYFGPKYSFNNSDTSYVFCSSDTIELKGSTNVGGFRWINWSSIVSNSNLLIIEGGQLSPQIKLKLLGGEDVVLYWRDDSPHDIYIKNGRPSIPRAGNDTIICQNTLKLTANQPKIGKGKWLSPNDPNITFQNNTLPNTTVSNLPRGKSTLIWQISSVCGILEDTLIVDNHAVNSNAGIDQNVCDDYAKLQANPLLTGQKGQWSLVGSVFSDSINPEVRNLKDGIANKFTWTVKDSICIATDEVAIFYNKPKNATILYPADSVIVVCSNQITLKVENTNGTWTQKNSSFSSNLQNVPVILSKDINTFYWEVPNGNCAKSVDSVKIINNRVFKPIVKHDTCFLSPQNSLILKAKSTIAGDWFATNSNVNLVRIDSLGASFNPTFNGHYAFYYRVKNGVCVDSSFAHYSVLTKAQLGNDTCLYVDAGNSVSISLKAKSGYIPNKLNGEAGSWKKDNAELLSNASTQINLKLPVGIHKYTWTVRDTTCLSCFCTINNTDTITITVSERAKITSGKTVCVNTDTISVRGNLPSGSFGTWFADNNVSQTSTGSKVFLSKLKIGDNKLRWNLVINGCISRDTITISRLTKPVPISDKCYPENVPLNEAIIGTKPTALEDASWNLPQNLTFSFTDSSHKIVIEKNDKTKSGKIIYSIQNQTCTISNFPNSVSINLSFLPKPKAPSDAIEPIPFMGKPILIGKNVVSSDSLRWFGANGEVLSKKDTLRLPNYLAGKYNFRFRIFSNNACFQEDTVAVTYITRAKITTNPCAKNVSNLKFNANPISAVEEGKWTVFPNTNLQLQFSTSTPNDLIINKLNSDSANAKFKITWTVYFKGDTSIKSSESIEFVNISDITKLSNFSNPAKYSSICAKDSFYYLNEAKNIKLRTNYETGYWIKKSDNLGRLKNGNTKVDTLVALKPSSQEIYFVIKDKNSSCSDTAKMVLNTVSKSKPSTQICTTDTVVQLNANMPVAGQETGLWSYSKAIVNKVPNFTNTTLFNSMVTGLGKRRTRLIWTITNVNDKTCFSADSVRVIVSTKAKIELKDPCLKGSTLVSLQGNAIEKYEKAAWFFATNKSDTISRKSIDTTSKAKTGSTKLYYVVSDTTFRTCFTRDSSTVHLINKALIVKENTCIEQSLDTSIEVKTTKGTSNTGMKYHWIKPYGIKGDTVSSLDSIHAFVLPSLGVRKFYWQVVSNQNASCFDTDSITLTTVSKAKAFTNTPICTTSDSANISATNVPNTIEKGTWSVLFPSTNAVAVLDSNSSQTKAIHLVERVNKLQWKIANKLNPGCFSVDTTNTTLVRNTAAKVLFSDTCIKAVSTVLLRGNELKSYERATWTLAKDTVLRMYQGNALASKGTATFVYWVADSVYKQCRTKDSLRVHVINKVNYNSYISCILKQPNQSSANVNISSPKDTSKVAMKYEWTKLKGFADDKVSDMVSKSGNDSTRFTFFQTGKRIYQHKISAVQNPTCFDTASVYFTVIPKATATLDSCLIGQKDTISLLSANSLDASKGEMGLWKSASSNVRIISNSKAAGLARGKTDFTWVVSNGACRDSVNRKVISVSKARITSIDTCQYFDANLEVDLKHAPLEGAFETGNWKAISSSVSINQFLESVTNLTKGKNSFQWKVKSSFDSSCASFANVSFNLLTPSGLSDDTLFTCSKETKIISTDSLSADEKVVWSMPMLQTSIVESSSKHVKLKNLSNNQVYVLYKQTNVLGCVLNDSLLIQNRQLDTVYIRPINELTPVLGKLNAFYTCAFSVGVKVSNPENDIPTSAQYSFKIETQADSLKDKQLINNGKEFKYNAIFNSSDSIHKFTWTVWNKSCVARSQTLELVKRKGLTNSDPFFSTSICQQTAFSFENSTINLISDPDSANITEKRLNGELGDFEVIKANVALKEPQNKMKVTGLTRGVHGFVYTAFKGGCSAATAINIVNSTNKYSVCSNLECDTLLKQLEFCNQDTTILTGKYDLVTPTFASDRFQIYWSNYPRIRENLDLIPLKIDENKSRVSVKVLNKSFDREKKIYLVSKNGVCDWKTDSVSITNFRDVKGQASIITTNKVVCESSVLLQANKPSFGSGTWLIEDTTVRLIRSNDTSTVLSKLKPSDKTIFWEVTNGRCHDTANLKLKIGLPVGNATLKMLNQNSICDSDSILLQAEAPQLNITGTWFKTLNDQSLSRISNQNEIKVPLEKGIRSNFVWVLNSELCSDSTKTSFVNYKKPTEAIVAEDQSVKSNSTILTGNEPQVGIGEWSVVSGSGQIVNPKSPKTEIQDLGFGETIVQWKIQNGVCPVSVSQIVINYSDFEIPQAFSPNGDGKNDLFVISGLENYPGSKFTVMNRWGKEVYSSSDYRNEWDGSGLDEDTYFYLIDIKGFGTRNGYLVLKRK